MGFARGPHRRRGRARPGARPHPPGTRRAILQRPQVVGGVAALPAIVGRARDAEMPAGSAAGVRRAVVEDLEPLVGGPAQLGGAGQPPDTRQPGRADTHSCHCHPAEPDAVPPDSTGPLRGLPRRDGDQPVKPRIRPLASSLRLSRPCLNEIRLLDSALASTPGSALR